MSLTNDVQSGFWIDYDRHPFTRQLVLVKDTTADAITNTVAITIALTLANLIRKLLTRIRMAWPAPETAPTPAIPLENTPEQSEQLEPPEGPEQHGQPATPTLPPATHPPSHVTHLPFREVARDLDSMLHGMFLSAIAMGRLTTNKPPELATDATSSTRRARIRAVLRRYRRNIHDQYPDILLLLLLFAACLLIFVGQSAFGIFSSRIVAGDSLARSNAPSCGIYVRPPSLPIYLSNASRNIQADTEMSSATYAKDCYGSNARQDGCHYFYRQSIPYHEVANISCPFGADVCPENSTAAYALTTGTFPVSYLGINVRRPYQANRTIVCTPLNMNSTFIRREMNDQHRPPVEEYRYYYGSSAPDPFTWANPTTPAFSFAQSAFYSAFVLTAWHGMHPPTWDPHVALAPPFGHSTVLWLIGSNRVMHLQPRQDPIFPTNNESELNLNPNTTLPIFVDVSNQLHALACSEEIQLCVPNGSYCQPLSTGPPPSQQWPNDTWPDGQAAFTAVYLAFVALKSSELYTSITTRLGSGLVASSKLSQALSLNLPELQWQVEVRGMFETALARSQVVVRDIARGTNAGEPGFINQLDHATDGAGHVLCGQYKFYAVGWKNIHFWGLVVIVMTLALFYLATSSPVLAFFQRPSVAMLLTAIGDFFLLIWYVITSTLMAVGRCINFPLIGQRIATAFTDLIGSIPRGGRSGVRFNAWFQEQLQRFRS